MPTSDLPFEKLTDFYRYEIIRKIAAGGMGVVCEAWQLGTDGFRKRVAIKTLLSKRANDSRFRRMFITEAKLVAGLVHENIVQIYQLSRSENGLHIVMELVNGISLHDFISPHAFIGPIPLDLVVFIVSRVARGLSYAHSRLDEEGRPTGIVHRDVCPNNILINSEGVPKLTDFGIARATNIAGPLDGKLVGKLYYMSPEQARQEEVDFRADIYSLGIVFFEMLTLSRPRRFENRTDEVLEVARSGELNWDLLPKSLPGNIRAILEKMLAFNPDDRYNRTSDLAYDLEYAIYSKGYGPTIVTLEKYLAEHFSLVLNPKVIASRRQKYDELERSTAILAYKETSGK